MFTSTSSSQRKIDARFSVIPKSAPTLTRISAKFPNDSIALRYWSVAWKITFIFSLVLAGRSRADWVKELKRISNEWIKQQGRDYSDFQWQGGYSDFSVSASNIERVMKYIANQEEHHRKLTYQDELRTLLRKHKMEWDERYVWD